MCTSCSDCSMDAKRDRSTQHRHHITEDKKGTHNKAERHGAIRIIVAAVGVRVSFVSRPSDSRISHRAQALATVRDTNVDPFAHGAHGTSDTSLQLTDTRLVSRVRKPMRTTMGARFAMREHRREVRDLSALHCHVRHVLHTIERFHGQLLRMRTQKTVVACAHRGKTPLPARPHASSSRCDDVVDNNFDATAQNFRQKGTSPSNALCRTPALQALGGWTLKQKLFTKMRTFS